jgi:hypothetical protein
MDKWPTSEEVFEVMKQLWPETYKDTVRIHYSPGFGEPVSAEVLARAMHKAISEPVEKDNLDDE